MAANNLANIGLCPQSIRPDPAQHTHTQGAHVRHKRGLQKVTRAP